jgi:hypothetical protein
MPSSSTERCRKHRARRRAGVGRFELELPLAALGETLVQAGWLADSDRDDVGRIHAALEHALQEWCAIDAQRLDIALGQLNPLRAAKQ